MVIGGKWDIWVVAWGKDTRSGQMRATGMDIVDVWGVRMCSSGNMVAIVESSWDRSSPSSSRDRESTAGSIDILCFREVGEETEASA